MVGACTSNAVNGDIIAPRLESDAVILIADIDAFDCCIGALADVYSLRELISAYLVPL
jgi:hypothetical protein